MGRRGEIYRIPSGRSLHRDPKDRRHVLLTSCNAGERAFACYGTTSRAELEKGSPAIKVEPRLRGRLANGFSEPTYFYPVILRPCANRELIDYTGQLTDSQVGDILGILPSALGFGTGNRLSVGVPARSRRGAVVRFSDDLIPRIENEFGVVLTAHAYSGEGEAFLAIVPLALDTDPEPEIDVLIEGDMFESLDPTSESALLMPTELVSIQTQDAHRTSVVIPNKYLAEAEVVLSRWFGLT